MALELFKPFFIQVLERSVRLEHQNASTNVTDTATGIWDALESSGPRGVAAAPTLHRLGIQAFEPVLIEVDTTSPAGL